ncbi:FUSC family protein [Stigmatella sp. ncwal1]|uniref:FUSC family protein n=1 Tax=Stigmatella ashevillensis TaxID=2995309 RepID=A0ABT5DLK5_9BACT|nr:FUSC family protein [Stigmatella ashevillena]MDC0714550.1 FUSC family protein [Stigmatella ashevillena]
MLRRLVEHTKEVTRFAPVKPAVMAGVRAAIATLFPVVVADALHIPDALWLSVGGFNTSFADRGGSYRTRALSMSAGLFAGALAAIAGGWVGQYPLLAIPVAFGWITACSYAGVFGAAANVVGNTSASAFVISMALPSSSFSEVLLRAGLLGLGGLWALVLSLVLWPIRPYRPARMAVSHCFQRVADYAGAVGQLSREGADAAAWQAVILGHHGRIREALEVAGSTLAATRRGRGEMGRGERLLVLLQMADALFRAMIALGDVMESLVQENRGTPGGEEVARTLAAFSATLQELARITETEGRPRTLPSLEWDAAAFKAILVRADTVGEPRPLEAGERAKCLHAARLLERLREVSGSAVRMATGLSGERVSSRSSPVVQRPSVLAPLRDNLSLDSVVLRHALRVGFTTTLAVGLSAHFIQSHGYWVTITVLTIMQPYTGTTFLKGLQRIAGTMVGGILAVAVASWFHEPQAILVLVFLTVAISIAVIPLNYGLYTVFLTLTFVLLAEVGTGDWGLARVRIINTLIGGALALACTWLLWERPERELFPKHLAAALRAHRDYVLLVFSSGLEGGRGVEEALSEAQRKMGLETLNAEASFQRLLSEPRRRTEPLEPLMTLLTYTRRLAASVVSIASSFQYLGVERSRERLEHFVSAAGRVLEDLAEAVGTGRTPASLDDFEEALGRSALPPEGTDSLLGIQLERVARHLTILHGAASRRGERAPFECPPTPDKASA